ncbi:VOC family protein [Phenylobacterium sp.]|jgi:catechol 2,3-dioxygenase-like lactoylglutathione lyase family enzyme|uniref:VOC family protein n=1 Tax=Phenylobacterium sp. TaxID=1871053 RepID=UPI002F3F1BD6
MTKSIRPRRMSHPNLVLEDFDASLAHLRTLFGAELLMDMPKPAWHACLVDIGGVVIEVFAPPAFLLNSRHGPHFLGMEYEADMTEVREAVAAHGIRIIRDLDVALHTHPADCFGVDFEFYEGTFYGADTPHMIQHVKPVEYWRDQHPLGLAGLKAYTLAVSDIEAATRFVQSFLSGEVTYETSRPAIAARAVGLQVADCVVELLTPDGDGPLQRQLQQIGQGIRSLVFRTRDIDQARRHFTEHDVELVAGTAPDSFAVAPAANLGVLFEFAE